VQTRAKAEAPNDIRGDTLGVSDGFVDGEITGEIGLVDATEHA
jgi:hypothetical protein